ncbi:MAG TPA: hypothetical protein VHD56_17340, partial [Tepidisphaeraceae bacterium]|nr:hypothetical protein [Tepidisphaeraceae bacterium]
MRNTQDMVLREQQRAEMAHYQPSAAQMPHNHPEPSIIRGILRNFWLVILFALVGGGISYLYLRKVKPLYLSEAKIEILPTGPKVLSDTLGSAQRSNYLYTQAELIKGTPVLSIVASKPEIRSLPSLQNVHGDLVMYLRNRVEAEVGRVNALITVSTYAPSPEDAAAIVNSVVQAYQELQLQETTTASSKMLDSLKNSKKEADDNLAQLDARKTEFQKKHSDLVFDSVFQQDLAVISQNWTAARIKSMELGAGYMKDNPAVIRARQTEEKYANLYEEARRKVLGLNVVQADWELLVAEQAKQQLFVNRLEERIKEIEVNHSAEQIFNQVEILEPARAADSASYPRKNRTMAIAIVAGMLLGAGLALLRDRLDGRMRSVEEIQNIIGLPILGVVP